jgi:hypothetical protein
MFHLNTIMAVQSWVVLLYFISFFLTWNGAQLYFVKSIFYILSKTSLLHLQEEVDNRKLADINFTSYNLSTLT